MSSKTQIVSYTLRGFNEAVNGFSDEGWSMLERDGIDDVTLLVNSSPTKMMMTSSLPFLNGFTSMPSAVLCAKASMLLQVISSLNLKIKILNFLLFYPSLRVFFCLCRMFHPRFFCDSWGNIGKNGQIIASMHIRLQPSKQGLVAYQSLAQGALEVKSFFL